LSQDFGAIILLLIVGFCLVGIVLVVIRLYIVTTRSRVKERLSNLAIKDQREPYTQSFSPGSYFSSGKFEGLRGWINRTLSFFSTEELKLKITTANWPISEVEFIITRFAVCLVGVLLGWIISGSIIGGIGLAVLIYIIPGILLDRSITRRRKKFQDMLVDFLVLVKGALLVGSSLQQAMNMAVKEIPGPVGEEFSQVLKETKLGLTLPEALHNLETRMQSEDLQIVVTGILLNIEMGGNLSVILEAAIYTIRDRMLVLGEVRSLTAYSRYVGWFLTLLPFLTALFIFISNPSFFDPVKTSSLSQIALVMAVLGVILGNFFIRRLTKIRI
jgi:tight adherence protein B